MSFGKGAGGSDSHVTVGGRMKEQRPASLPVRPPATSPGSPQLSSVEPLGRTTPHRRYASISLVQSPDSDGGVSSPVLSTSFYSSTSTLTRSTSSSTNDSCESSPKTVIEGLVLLPHLKESSDRRRVEVNQLSRPRHDPDFSDQSKPTAQRDYAIGELLTNQNAARKYVTVVTFERGSTSNKDGVDSNFDDGLSNSKDAKLSEYASFDSTPIENERIETDEEQNLSLEAFVSDYFIRPNDKPTEKFDLRRSEAGNDYRYPLSDRIIAKRENELHAEQSFQSGKVLHKGENEGRSNFRKLDSDLWISLDKNFGRGRDGRASSEERFSYEEPLWHDSNKACGDFREKRIQESSGSTEELCDDDYLVGKKRKLEGEFSMRTTALESDEFDEDKSLDDFHLDSQFAKEAEEVTLSQQHCKFSIRSSSKEDEEEDLYEDFEEEDEEDYMICEDESYPPEDDDFGSERSEIVTGEENGDSLNLQFEDDVEETKDLAMRSVKTFQLGPSYEDRAENSAENLAEKTTESRGVSYVGILAEIPFIEDVEYFDSSTDLARAEGRLDVRMDRAESDRESKLETEVKPKQSPEPNIGSTNQQRLSAVTMVDFEFQTCDRQKTSEKTTNHTTTSNLNVTGTVSNQEPIKQQQDYETADQDQRTEKHGNENTNQAQKTSEVGRGSVVKDDGAAKQSTGTASQDHRTTSQAHMTANQDHRIATQDHRTASQDQRTVSLDPRTTDQESEAGYHESFMTSILYEKNRLHIELSDSDSISRASRLGGITTDPAHAQESQEAASGPEKKALESSRTFSETTQNAVSEESTSRCHPPSETKAATALRLEKYFLTEETAPKQNARNSNQTEDISKETPYEDFGPADQSSHLSEPHETAPFPEHRGFQIEYPRMVDFERPSSHAHAQEKAFHQDLHESCNSDRSDVSSLKLDETLIQLPDGGTSKDSSDNSDSNDLPENGNSDGSFEVRIPENVLSETKKPEKEHDDIIRRRPDVVLREDQVQDEDPDLVRGTPERHTAIQKTQTLFDAMQKEDIFRERAPADDLVTNQTEISKSDASSETPPFISMEVDSIDIIQLESHSSSVRPVAMETETSTGLHENWNSSSNWSLKQNAKTSSAQVQSPSDTEDPNQPPVDYLAPVEYLLHCVAGNVSDILDTSPDLFVSIVGSNGQTSCRRLVGRFAPHPGGCLTGTFAVKDVPVGLVKCVKLFKASPGHFYLNYIIVSTPYDNRCLTMSCCQWLPNDELPVILREAKGVLEGRETDKDLAMLRIVEMTQRRKRLRWRERRRESPPLPGCLDPQDALASVAESGELRRLQRRWEVRQKQEKESVWQKLVKLLKIKDASSGSFVIRNDSTGGYLGNVQHALKKCRNDEQFAKTVLTIVPVERVAILRKIPESFTSAAGDNSREYVFGGTDFQSDSEESRYLLISFTDLPGFFTVKSTASVERSGDQCNTGPELLLTLRTHERERIFPLAIRIMTAGKSQIFTKSRDDVGDYSHWTVAKMLVQIAATKSVLLDDCLTHRLLLEPVSIALDRNLPSVHPIHKLLKTHLRNLPALNSFHRKHCSSAGHPGILGAGDGNEDRLVEYISRRCCQISLFKYCLPEMLQSMRTTAMPSCLRNITGHLFDHWLTIEKFVRTLLSGFYEDDVDVASDTELVALLIDLREEGLPFMEVPKMFETFDSLVHFASAVMFLRTVYQADVNRRLRFIRDNYLCPLPFLSKFPTDKAVRPGGLTESELKKMMPPGHLVQEFVQFIDLLSEDEVSEKQQTPSWWNTERQFADASALAALDTYQENLRRLRSKST